MYREKYGYFYDDVPAETVNLRVLGELVGGELELLELPSGESAEVVPAGHRPAYSARHRAMMEFAVHDRKALRPGMYFNGPAVVEEASATTVIDDGGQVEIDRYGSLVISLEVEERS